jgi:hypothetical protein
VKNRNELGLTHEQQKKWAHSKQANGGIEQFAEHTRQVPCQCGPTGIPKEFNQRTS